MRRPPTPRAVTATALAGGVGSTQASQASQASQGTLPGSLQGTSGPSVPAVATPLRHRAARRTEVLWWAGMHRPSVESSPDGMESGSDRTDADTDDDNDGDDDDDAPSSPVFNRKHSSKRKRAGAPASQQQQRLPPPEGGVSGSSGPLPPLATATTTIASFMSPWGAAALWYTGLGLVFCHFLRSSRRCAPSPTHTS